MLNEGVSIETNSRLEPTNKMTKIPGGWKESTYKAAGVEYIPILLHPSLPPSPLPPMLPLSSSPRIEELHGVASQGYQHSMYLV